MLFCVFVILHFNCDYAFGVLYLNSIDLQGEQVHIIRLCESMMHEKTYEADSGSKPTVGTAVW